MSPTLQELGIDRLSNEERLRLIGEIWDSLTPINQLQIPESHREELDRRLASCVSCFAGNLRPFVRPAGA